MSDSTRRDKALNIKKGDLVNPRDSCDIRIGVVIEESHRICKVFFPTSSRQITCFLKRKLEVISRL